MIHYGTRKLFEKYLFEDAKIVEFGDQFVNYNVGGDHVRRRTDQWYKQEIISIDKHGKNRALKLDLSKTIAAAKLPIGDIVTDFGTLEHVKSLFYGLKNAFNACKVGGVMIHANPKVGHFPEHNDYHHFTPEFWKQYGKAAKLEMVELAIEAAYHNHNTGKEVYAVLRKTEKSKFPTKKAFDAIYATHIKAKGEAGY